MGEAREVLDRLTAAVTETHDVNAVVNLYADDAVVVSPDGEMKGKQQITDWWKMFVEGFPDAKYEYVSKLETGDRAADEGYYIGTHRKEIKTPTGETVKPTGKKIKMRSVDVATVKNGKIKSHHVYYDEAEFMRQLGLAEASR
ncbi:ester cyclase [Allorhizocola rhizosphaerae]|uniref:ester cyclase n=1 Tax=Allorhizocola rhizosphaerae TaxID=1872709 RepID=UPI000E3BDD99|nr:ester cyclase [Allorhizocola rhizosphaerae]